MPSFDIVSEVDLQEVRNAVDQANREAATRFDFKNTDSTIEMLPNERNFGPTQNQPTATTAMKVKLIEATEPVSSSRQG